jgi:tyrosyl-tRNA synthetase
MLLQAYDFLHLFESNACRLQAGGSDQWGNITAGIDLIRKIHGEEAFGLTFPLLQTSSGEKFGKSAGNAVWLDEAATSAYHFYQFWFNQEDRDVERLLKLFTFSQLEEIDAVVRAHAAEPEKRTAQRLLARQVTEFVHGRKAAEEAERAAAALFTGRAGKAKGAVDLDALADAPTVLIERRQLQPGVPLLQLLLDAGIVDSKAAGRRLIDGGGLYLNDVRVETIRTITLEDFGESEALVIRTGKRKHHVLRLEPAR